MSCRELSDQQIWAYLDGDITTDERRLVEEQLARSSQCAARLEQLRRRPLALGEQRLIAPPPDFHRRVMARIMTEAQPRWPADRWTWLSQWLMSRRAMATATAALVLAFICTIVVGAALAAPAVDAALPRGSTPLANSMGLAIRLAIQPLGSIFADWGWIVLVVGMVAGLLVLGARAVIVRRRESS